MTAKPGGLTRRTKNAELNRLESLKLKVNLMELSIEYERKAADPTGMGSHSMHIINNVQKLTGLNIMLRTIKSYVKNCKYQFSISVNTRNGFACHLVWYFR
jgi:hypothetical protein